MKRPSGRARASRVQSHASTNAAAAADRRFGMPKRSEQSRGHGPHDPRWTNHLHALSDTATADEALVPPESSPPILTLVGGTDVAPEPVASRAVTQA